MLDDFQIYIRNCRIAANLSIDRASELLEISPRTLSSYEAGELRTNDKIAARMAKVYHNKLIPYKWLLNTECGRTTLPAIEDRNLSELILEILECRELLEQRQHRLISIGKDNIVDHLEEPEYMDICSKCLKPLIKNGMALVLVEIKKDRSCGCKNG